ncbi:MAG: TetR/AcrR family transcriptional regulator [Nitrospirota bacterium]|nr:TetR/AcrR family transcriptional regulator [Nitrospirota bacterium]
MSTEEADIRARILEAAEARFRVYGFNKTTMAEVASDCRMSAANLYRYFDSKQAIGAAIAERCIGEQASRLRQLIRDNGPTAGEKIERFVIEVLHYTYEQLAGQPKMAELVEHICAERKDLVREGKLHQMVSLVAEIIAEGNRSGEFAVDDVIGAAHGVVMATVPFHSPFIIMSGVFEKAELEVSARQVAGLLVQGLAAR